MKTHIIAGMVGIGAICLAAPSFAADTADNNEVKIVTVDYKGKPPFKRRTETLPMAAMTAKAPSAPTLLFYGAEFWWVGWSRRS